MRRPSARFVKKLTKGQAVSQFDGTFKEKAYEQVRA